MGGGGGSPPPYQPPPAPDPVETSKAQTASNVQTAIANSTIGATNQVGPYGSLTYAQTGGQQVGDNWVPQWTATQTMSPEQKAIYDKGNAIQNQALDMAPGLLTNVNRTLQTPLDYNGLYELPTDQKALRDEAYGALTARSTSDINNAVTETGASLRNQGVQEGSEAWRRAMEPLERSRVDASNQATINTGNIASQNLTMAQLLRNQGIKEREAVRNQPLLDLQSVLGFGGGVTPQTWATPAQGQVMPTDVSGNINANYAAQQQNAQTRYQGQMEAHKSGVASGNAAMGGMMGMAGAAIGAGAFII